MPHAFLLPIPHFLTADRRFAVAARNLPRPPEEVILFEHERNGPTRSAPVAAI